MAPVAEDEKEIPSYEKEMTNVSDSNYPAIMEEETTDILVERQSSPEFEILEFTIGEHRRSPKSKHSSLQEAEQSSLLEFEQAGLPKLKESLPQSKREKFLQPSHQIFESQQSNANYRQNFLSMDSTAVDQTILDMEEETPGIRDGHTDNPTFKVGERELGEGLSSSVSELQISTTSKL